MMNRISKYVTLWYYKQYRYIRNNYVVISLTTLFFIFTCLYYNHVYQLECSLRELSDYAVYHGHYFNIFKLNSYTSVTKILINLSIVIYILLNIKKGYLWYIWTVTCIIIFAALTLLPPVEYAWTSYMYNYPPK